MIYAGIFDGMNPQDEFLTGIRSNKKAITEGCKGTIYTFFVPLIAYNYMFHKVHILSREWRIFLL